MRRRLLIVLISLASIFSLYLAREFLANQHRAEEITLAIRDIQLRSTKPLELQIPNGGVPMPPPPQESAREHSDSSIEIRALGNELRLINQASWSMIIKFCFTWAFILATVLAYRIIDRKYA